MTSSTHDVTTKTISITVNGASVEMADRQASGAAIKKAAIASGVPIESDFVLYERRGASGTYTRINDDDVVVIHDGELFRAVAPDDVA
jgi:multiubiquitin